MALIISSCTDEDGQSLSGVVSDFETGESLKGVDVVLSGEEIFVSKTDDKGVYVFKNIKANNYTLLFSNQGYGSEEMTMFVGGRMGINNYDASLRRKNSVILEDILTISDGAYFIFSPPSNTKVFYWNTYPLSEDTRQEESIITDLLANGIKMDGANYTEGYYWGLVPRTNYVLYTIAFDANNISGELYRVEFSTKSATNQPISEISINEISNGSVLFDAKRNNFCSSYALMGWDNIEESIDNPDIWWAAALHWGKENDEIYSEDLTSYEWNNWELNTTCVIVTLGYDINGNNSGVISKKFFSTRTNTVLRSNDLQNNLKSSTEKRNKQIGGKDYSKNKFKRGVQK